MIENLAMITRMPMIENLATWMLTRKGSMSIKESRNQGIKESKMLARKESMSIGRIITD